MKNKIYWLAILSALVLLLCSVIYTDPLSGQKYTFLSLFYVEDMQMLLQYGELSMHDILMEYGISNYLYMFCPIIVGIPCILTQKVERFELFRTSKNRYFLYKYVSNLVLGGCIMLTAHLLFDFVGTALAYVIAAMAETPFAQISIWDSYLAQKLVSVFCEGMRNALPGILLAEFLRNKYLILCIPFVWNYFVTMFVGSSSSILLLVVEILAGGFLIKFTVERRCDCGQK